MSVRERECSKVRYETEAAAWKALFEIALSPDWPSGHKPIRPYRCGRCGGRWHLTSKGKEQA